MPKVLPNAAIPAADAVNLSANCLLVILFFSIVCDLFGQCL
jgi:hypothetical protein